MSYELGKNTTLHKNIETNRANVLNTIESIQHEVSNLASNDDEHGFDPNHAGNYAHKLMNSLNTICLSLWDLNESVMNLYGHSYVRDSNELTHIASMVRERTNNISSDRMLLSEYAHFANDDLMRMIHAATNFLMCQGREGRDFNEYGKMLDRIITAAGVPKEDHDRYKTYLSGVHYKTNATALDNALYKFSSNANSSYGLVDYEQRVVPFIIKLVIKIAYLLKVYAMRHGVA